MSQKNLTLEDLQKKTLKEIYEYAREYKIKYYSQMNKKELSLAVIRAQAEQDDFRMKGILEIFYDDGGYGFLRPLNYSPSKEDIYLSASQIKRFGLRNGDEVAGRVRPPRKGSNNDRYGMMYIDAVNGKDPDEAKGRPHFPALTAIYPDKKLVLENNPKDLSTRLIDLFAPVGFGQRGMIVAPPKAGKTTFLKNIAAGISKNAKDAKLIVLLIDERPEEVTDLEDYVSSINPNGEVVYSTFDQRPESHVHISEMVLERAMRLVEDKQDVVILLDSLTRLARAYNLVIPSSGKTLSGGLDPTALYRPKKFFGSARNVREGGSLTIIATALVETGSRQDDIIFEEFKGTGNQELQLNRDLAERRIFPAVDIKKSGTRKEELLLTKEELEAVWKLRKISTSDTVRFTNDILKIFKQTKDNAEFCQKVEYFSKTKRSGKKIEKRYLHDLKFHVIMKYVAIAQNNSDPANGSGQRSEIIMKQGIHPDYHEVVFLDSATGYKFLSGSTKTSSETIEWEDGKTYPLIRVEISCDSHPFYTGKQKFTQADGRVDRFNKKYGFTK